ncbi:MAG: rod-binding protein [Lachnospiraceae bacterium]|nr:rod-binding protein [Lachnospiraceae bacterium]
MDIGSIAALNDIRAIENKNTSKLKNSLENTDYAKSSNEDLLAACKEFEAFFLEMVFKEMQKSVDALSDKKDQPTSQLVNYFKDMTIQKIAADSTETQGLGLAQQLFEQMKRNYNL